MPESQYIIATVGLHIKLAFAALFLTSFGIIFTLCSIVSVSTLFFFLPIFLFKVGDMKATMMQKLENDQMRQTCWYFLFLGLVTTGLQVWGLIQMFEHKDQDLMISA